MRNFSGKPPHGGSGKRGPGAGRAQGPNRGGTRQGGGREERRDAKPEAAPRDSGVRAFGAPRPAGVRAERRPGEGRQDGRHGTGSQEGGVRSFGTQRPAGTREPQVRAFGGGPRKERRPDAHRGSGAPRAGAAQGGLWIYGLHAVEAALRNPHRRLRRLLVTPDAEAALGARLPQPWNAMPEPVERGQIERLLGHDVVHQGAALLADPLPTPTLQAMLERPGPVLVLDQVTDPRNIGAILRSAAAFGAAGVIVQERNAPEETGALAKAASGALETVPLLRAVNLARTLVALKAADVWTIGLAAGGKILNGPSCAGRRVALVLGAEGDGLRRLTRETCDEIASLPMPGGFESLNVSAAAAVALYEITRPAAP